MATETVSRSRPKGKAETRKGKIETRMARFAPHLPYEDFPLFPVIDKKTGTGRWGKKILQSLKYFGSLADGWEPALARYKAEAEYLHAGRAVPENIDGLTIARLCDHFYAAKEQRRAAGEITVRTLAEYFATCKMLSAALGGRLVDDVNAQDFAKIRVQLADRFGPVRLVNEIVRARGVFKWGDENAMLSRPMRFGSEFKKPSKKTLRLSRASKPKKLFTADEVRQLIEAADANLKAMILLGVNAGMGNADVSALNRAHLDLSTGVLDFPRPKTGIARRAVLWPVTVAAIKAAIIKRPEHKNAEDAAAVFITKYGHRWATGSQSTAVGLQFGRLLKKIGIERKGVNFYALRHTFRTIADASKDQRAADYIMGQVSEHISSEYVEQIDDTRLHAVADHVHRWLFGEPMAMATTGKRGGK